MPNEKYDGGKVSTGMRLASKSNPKGTTPAKKGDGGKKLTHKQGMW